MNVFICFPEKQIEGSFLFWGVRSTSHPICSGLKHIGMVSLISNIFFISWNIPFRDITPFWLGFPGGSVGKESACNARDLGSIPRSGRSPGEGNGNPPQYSCLENPMDRGAWQAIVHRVAKSQTHLKWLSMQVLCSLNHCSSSTPLRYGLGTASSCFLFSCLFYVGV